MCKFYFVTFFIFSFCKIFCQTEMIYLSPDSAYPNYIDEKGLKQGWWKSIDDSSGNIILCSYFLGELDGSFYVFNKNVKVYEVNYDLGSRNGWARFYDSKGRIIHLGLFRNDTLSYHIKFKRNGKIYEENETLAYVKHGKYIFYTKRGIVKSSITYKDGKKDGQEIFFHKNGRPSLVSNYSNNIENGVRIKYSKNGKIQKKHLFTNGKLEK
ncbi:MAG: hypothetical protein HJHJAOHD_02526 [Flavobacteriales bacterium]|nr:hypothetical protein [Flavobacteriales bacterium]